jgi:hypothetical protein
MLIDRSHRPWIAASSALGGLALAAYGGLAWVAGGWPPAPVRLAYGVAGSALVLFAGLLAAHRRLPRWWGRIGARTPWLKGHVWLGLLSAPLLLCHGGFRLGGPLTAVLWLAYALTVLTGLVGLALQQLLPHVLAGHVEALHRPPEPVSPGGEWPEPLPAACARLRRAADRLFEEACGPEPDEPSGRGGELWAVYLRRLRPLLEEPPRPGSVPGGLSEDAAFELLGALSAGRLPAARLEELRRIFAERGRLGEFQRLYRWLHGWRRWHALSAAATLALGAAHACAALALVSPL